MTRFQQQSVRRVRLKRAALWAALICGLVFWVSFGLALHGGLSGPVVWAGAPLLRLSQSIGGGLYEFSAGFKSKQVLQAQNDLLAQQLAEANWKLLQAQALQQELSRLRNFAVAAESQVVLARVLSKPPRSPYDSLLVDVGSAQDVNLGDHALAGEAILLGEVVEVHSHTSLVRLFSTPGLEYNVAIGPDRIQAKAVGQGSGNFATLLPRGVHVAEGDAVIVPVLGDYIFATVAAVEGNDTDTFQKILFRNPVNMAELSAIHIVPAPATD